MKRWIFTILAGLAVAAVIGGAWYAVRPQPYAFGGGELIPANPAPELALTDQFGDPYSIADDKGKVTLLYFGYTICPDLCPTTLNDFSIIKEDLGPLADRTRYLLVTIDPERDTRERMAEYLGFFDPTFVGLTGTQEQIDAAVQAYGVTVRRVEHPESATGYLMDHSALTYLIDPDGNLRVTYPYGTDPAIIAADVKHLLEG
jgi:protein SCO1/2